MEFFLLLLLQTLSIEAEIDRRDGATNTFGVINHGRINHLNVLMFFEEISLYECINYCIMYVQCHSLSYSSTAKLCELNDMEFDKFEADTDITGWINYGTPPKVDGGFSDWKNVTGCSKSCDIGHVTYMRSCDNQKPQQVDGGFSVWKNVTGCSKSCDGGHMTYIRSCDNPKPQHGGASCIGDTRKTEPCYNRICNPVCYGARLHEYGEFIVPQSGTTKAIHLSHISGGLKCSTTSSETYWGCTHSTEIFATYITDTEPAVLFPLPSARAYNNNIRDHDITLKREASINLVAGQTLRIYYREDLFNIYPSDNSGKHCIYVEIIYD